MKRAVVILLVLALAMGIDQGIAKGKDKQLPPGLEKRQQNTGKPLPPGWQKNYPKGMC